MLTVSIANHKGGVGKTTTARTLGSVLSQSYGLRVLLVDVDPQASLTRSCNIMEAAEANMNHVLGGASRGTMALGDVLFEVSDRLFLAPADISLSVTELALVSRHDRERILAKSLASLSEHFDLAIIDTAPSLGLLSVNALVASDGVIVPVVPEILALRGLSLFLDTLDGIREELNPRLRLLGVLITMFDARTIHHRDGVAAIRKTGCSVFNSFIGRSIKVSESAIWGESITEYEPDHQQAIAYRAFAEEVLQCLNLAARA